MEIVQREKSVVACGRGGMPCLELQLSRTVYAAGKQLSGVVMIRLNRPMRISGLTVSLSGRETPKSESLSRSLRRTASFFNREIVLSGMQQPRLTHERMSQIWNAFLGRSTGRVLSAGEHTYPFSINLPASLPPSHDGPAGRLAYTVSVKAQPPLGRTIRIGRDVKVVAVPRSQRARPVALTYPTADGAVHANGVSVSLEMPGRAVALGVCIPGKIIVSNPLQAPIREMSIALETCEWVRFAADKELNRRTVDQNTLKPVDPEASAMQGDFELRVPADAAPTVEGTAISVIWFLRMRIDTDPAIEFKTPLFVYSPSP